VLEKTVYFGTEDDLTLIKCPSTGLTRSLVSWRTSGTYLSGGGYSRASGVAHNELSVSWGGDSVEDFATLITQINKNEVLYYLDPLSMKTNILPPYAAQYQPDNPYGVSSVSGGAGSNGYPAKASVYSSDTTLYKTPVPSGYRLWVGAHGTGSVNVSSSLASGTVTAIPTANTNRVTTSFVGGSTYTLSAAANSTFYGVVAQILPEGVTPTTGGFIPGMGFSGLRVKDDPQITEYSATLENYQIAMTVNFIEVETWES